MTNEELKKKIVEIINDGIIPGAENFGVSESKMIENIADALIAAGIGDVGETKEKLKKINERILLGDIIACDLSAKCAEHKYRAEVAGREAIILSKWLAEKTRKDYPWQAWFDAAQKQAEKELAEEGKDGRI